MNILVFGDSIARWAFDAESWGRAERLKTHFFASYKQHEIWVYNMSVSSNDVRWVYTSMQYDINKVISITWCNNVAIIIAIWTNEPRHIWSIGNVYIKEDEFKDTFIKIIAIAQSYSKYVFVVWWFPIDEDIVNPWYGEEYYFNNDLKYYDHIMSDISTQHHATFISLRDHITYQDLSDWLHPNTQWHYIIYQHILQALNQHLL
jgi:hypothetical protein